MRRETAKVIIGYPNELKHTDAALDPGDEKTQEGVQELIDYVEANYL